MDCAGWLYNRIEVFGLIDLFRGYSYFSIFLIDLFLVVFFSILSLLFSLFLNENNGEFYLGKWSNENVSGSRYLI